MMFLSAACVLCIRLREAHRAVDSHPAYPAYVTRGLMQEATNPRNDLEMGVVADSKFMAEYFEDVEKIKSKMHSIRDNTKLIAQKHQEALTAVTIDKGDGAHALPASPLAVFYAGAARIFGRADAVDCGLTSGFVDARRFVPPCSNEAESARRLNDADHGARPGGAASLRA